MSQFPVALKPRFAEPLVGGRIVRKIAALAPVLKNIGRLVTSNGGLNIDLDPRPCLRPHVVAADGIHGTRGLAQLRSTQRMEVASIGPNINTQVIPALADNIAEVRKLVVAILGSI